MKYQGSKNRIAKDILSIILKDEQVKNCEYWVEPFVGGANMIDKVKGFKRIGNDINEYIIKMFQALQSGWEIPKIDKEKYNELNKNSKGRYNSCLEYDALIGYAGICCSYSGKWFGGFADKVKTKIGTIRDYQKEARENILKQLPNILDVDFRSVPYNELEIPKNSIIYCDPPYKGTTKYKDSFDHDKFWEWCDKMVRLGNIVYVSEYNAPGYWTCVWKKEVKSSLSANGKIGGSKNSIEKLFTKYISSFEANQD